MVSFAVFLLLCIGGNVYGSSEPKLQSVGLSKFIVWFRNETSLLVLWNPPDPSIAYTRFKVSISPPDAKKSELYIETNDYTPGPEQAAFIGLVPGREYNISLQTMSGDEVSASIFGRYRTVPSRPRNVNAPLADLTETSFTVTWQPPAEDTEFDQYHVSVKGGGGKRLKPSLHSKSDTSATFEGLEPGANYTVTVKTMSGKVTSRPSTTELTLKPLPVTALTYQNENKPYGGAIIKWEPSEGSTQDSYKVSWQEDSTAGDSGMAFNTTDTSVLLDALLPGRKYNVTVSSVSSAVESNASLVTLAMRPLAPILARASVDLNSIEVRWYSDTESFQDSYELRYRRTAEPNEPFQTFATVDTTAYLTGLSPDTTYEIDLVAISHGLRSGTNKIIIDTSYYT